MVELAQRRQKIVNVKVLFVDGDGTLCHFSAVIIAHELVEGVEAGNNIRICSHLVKEHRQRGAKFTALRFGNPVIFGFPESKKERLD